MPCPASTTNWIAVAMSFFGGGLVGVLISHFLTIQREKLTRLNHFRGQLSRWRCHFYREQDPIAYYREVAGDIAYECGIFAQQRPDMKESLWQLYSFKSADLETEGQKKLIEYIQSIMTKLGAHPTA